MKKRLLLSLAVAMLMVFAFAPAVYAFEDNNDTPETATPIALDQKVDGVTELALDTSGSADSYDMDYYVVKLDRKMWVNFKVSPAYDGMNVKITDLSGTKEYDDKSALSEDYSYVAKLSAGDYLIAIRATWPNRSGSYKLEVSSTDIKLTGTVYPITVNPNLKFTKAELTWDKMADADGYIVYQYDKKSKKYKMLKDTKKTSVTVKTPAVETTYKYKVAAYIDLGDGKKAVGPKSEVKQVSTMPKKVGKPTIIGISYGKTIQVKGYDARIFVLKWKKVKGATGYYVYGKSDTQDWKILDTVDANKAYLYGGIGFKYKLQVVPYRRKNGLVTTGTPSKIFTTPTIK